MREERRVVTVLFADVVGSTPLGERLDPEDVRLVVGGAISRMIAAVEDFGGSVKDLAGDGVLALFGAPAAHEDDPERAVRSGLRIVGEIGEYAREVEAGWGVPGFSVRVGIATGPVVLGPVGTGGRIEYGAAGDTVNTAARLQAAADPGSVLVGSSTTRMIEPIFEWGEARSLSLKGKAQPVEALPAVRLRPSPGATKARSLDGSQTRLIGRDRELSVAWTAVDEVLAGTGGVLFVTGEAGIGKSRLLTEVRARFEASDSPGGRPLWLEGQCVSYGEATPYGPFRDLLRNWLGLTSEAPDLRARVALRREAERLRPDGTLAIYPFVGTILGLSLEPHAAAHVEPLSPEGLQRRTFDAMLDVLSALSDLGPVVVALDDLQWADPTSTQLVEGLLPLADRAAVLAVLAFRLDRDHPSYRLRETALRELPHRVREIPLEALPEDTDDELLSAMVGPGTLPPAVRTRLLTAAAGNPFFLEELVGSMEDAGALVRAGDGWRFDHDVALSVPETLQKVILARMDRLSSAHHDVLTAAAVLGRQFPLTLLEEVVNGDGAIEETLRELQRLDLLRETRRWPVREYRFRHPLIQEAAYGSMLGERRRQLHRRAGDAIERLAPDRLEEQLTTVAHHYREAGDEERAVEYLRRAGDAARRVFAVDEAIELYSAAVDAVDRMGAGDGIGAELRLLRGKVEFESGRFAPAGQDLEAALEGSRRASDRTLEVRCLEELGTLLLMWGGRAGEAISLLDEGLRVASDIADVSAQVSILNRLCVGHSNELRFAEAGGYGERALALARAEGEEVLVARAMDGVKLVAAQLGDFDTLGSLIPEMEAILRRTGDQWYLQWALFESSYEPSARGRWDEAEARVREALEVSAAIGDRAAEPYFLAGLGWLQRSRGEYGQALEAGRRAVAAARDFEHGWWSAWTEALLGWTLLDVGVVDEALGHLHKGLQAAERMGTRQYVLWCLGHLAWGHCLRGDLERAVEVADRAEGLLAEVSTPPGMVLLHGAPIYLSVGWVRARAGDVDRAERLVLPIVEAAEAVRWEEVVAEGSLLAGRCAMARADQRAAERLLGRAAEVSSAKGLPGIAWRADGALADLLLSRGRGEEARDHLVRARTVVDRLAASLDDVALRRPFVDGAMGLLGITPSAEESSNRPP